MLCFRFNLSCRGPDPVVSYIICKKGQMARLNVMEPERNKYLGRYVLPIYF